MRRPLRSDCLRGGKACEQLAEGFSVSARERANTPAWLRSAAKLWLSQCGEMDWNLCCIILVLWLLKEMCVVRRFVF